ncbi:hypothetical protein BC826DRAFT_90095 [Russula brevipes]|nr:hypothetical protein BC826DRAFT_90095 [Russula brevipes]
MATLLVRVRQRFYTVEDGQPTILTAAMDATRVRDNLRVMLKRALPADGPHELIINQQFSSPELAAVPHNHYAPLLDVVDLQHPEPQKLMVFPLLRPFNQPRCKHLGNSSTASRRFVRAFKSCMNETLPIAIARPTTSCSTPLECIRMGPIVSKLIAIGTSSVLRKLTPGRSALPYYFIDFGLSRQYASRDALDEPVRGGDKSAPEHRSQTRCNPFQTDIYYIGNLVHQEFVEKYHGFEFMEGLINSMTLEDPARRPSIEHVIQKFTDIRASLSKSKLRSPLISRRLPKLFWVVQQALQSIRTMHYIVSRRPAIPMANVPCARPAVTSMTNSHLFEQLLPSLALPSDGYTRSDTSNIFPISLWAFYCDPAFSISRKCYIFIFTLSWFIRGHIWKFM